MTKAGTFNYNEKTAELERILAQLQEPDVPLDAALKLHAKGKAIVGELEIFLQQAENEVKQHIAKD